MKKFMIIGAATLLVALLAPAAMAAQSDTQTVNFAVNEIQQIDVNDAAVSLTVVTAVAGSDPTAVTAPSSYSITVNSNSDRKITGVINSAMPTGVTLKVALAPPAVGTSTSDQTLSATAVDLVTGMSKTKGLNRDVTYTLSATAEAGEVSGARTVTYTISGS